MSDWRSRAVPVSTSGDWRSRAVPAEEHVDAEALGIPEDQRAKVERDRAEGLALSEKMKSVPTPQSDMAAALSKNKFKGDGADSAAVSFLNSAAQGLLPQTLAAQDALRAATGGVSADQTKPLPGPLDDPKGFVMGLEGKLEDTGGRLLQAAKHPIDTFTKAKDVYHARVPEYRDAMEKKSETMPWSSFAGGMAGGLLAGPRNVAQAAISPAAQAFNSSERVSQGNYDPAALAEAVKNAAVSGGLGAAGFKAPLATAAGLASSSNATRDDLMNLVTGVAGGAAHTFGSKAREMSSGAREEIAAPIRDAAELERNQAEETQKAIRQDIIDRVTARDKATAKEQKSGLNEFLKDAKNVAQQSRALDKSTEGGERAKAAQQSQHVADLDAAASGELGRRISEFLRLGRSLDIHDQVPEEGNAGVQAVMPDQRSRYLALAEQLKGGKEALLQQIKQEMAAKRAQPEVSASAGASSVGPEGLEVATPDAPNTVEERRAALSPKSPYGPLPIKTLDKLAADNGITLGMLESAMAGESPAGLGARKAEKLFKQLGVPNTPMEEVVARRRELMDSDPSSEDEVLSMPGSPRGAERQAKREAEKAAEAKQHTNLGVEYAGDPRFKSGRVATDRSLRRPILNNPVVPEPNAGAQAAFLRKKIMEKYANMAPEDSQDEMDAYNRARLEMKVNMVKPGDVVDVRTPVVPPPLSPEGLKAKVDAQINAEANPLKHAKDILKKRGGPIGMTGAAVQALTSPELRARMGDTGAALFGNHSPIGGSTQGSAIGGRDFSEDTALENAAARNLSLLNSDPGIAKSYGKVLAETAARSPTSLLALITMLRKTDPAFKAKADRVLGFQ